MNDASRPYLKNPIWLGALKMYNVDDGDTDYRDLNDLSDNCLNDALYQATIIHEFAHTMGAIDVYSDKRVNGVINHPAGRYSMQSEDIAGHDVYNMLGFRMGEPICFIR